MPSEVPPTAIAYGRNRRRRGRRQPPGHLVPDQRTRIDLRRARQPGPHAAGGRRRSGSGAGHRHDRRAQRQSDLEHRRADAGAVVRAATVQRPDVRRRLETERIGRGCDRRGDRPAPALPRRRPRPDRHRPARSPIQDLGDRAVRQRVARRRDVRRVRSRNGSRPVRQGRQGQPDLRRRDQGHRGGGAGQGDPPSAPAPARRAHCSGAGRHRCPADLEPAFDPDRWPARFRIHRRVRRGVRHLQHVLDHGRPAHRRVRSAACARRDTKPGAPRGAHRGGGDRTDRVARGARGRSRRGGRDPCAVPRRGLQPSLRRARARRAHGARRARGRRARDGRRRTAAGVARDARRPTRGVARSRNTASTANRMATRYRHPAGGAARDRRPRARFRSPGLNQRPPAPRAPPAP